MLFAAATSSQPPSVFCLLTLFTVNHLPGKLQDNDKGNGPATNSTQRKWLPLHLNPPTFGKVENYAIL